jgi:hypothetical protein
MPCFMEKPKKENLINKLFQQSSKHRRSGMDRRNLGSMDGGAVGRPCNLDS